MKQMAKRKKILLVSLAVVLAGGAVGTALYLREDGTEYILLTNGVRNFGDFEMFAAFESEIKANGGIPKVLEIEDAKNASARQNLLLEENVGKNTGCVLVNGATNSNLEELLGDYMDEGIPVASFQSEVSEGCRNLHIGAVDPNWVGSELLKKTNEICGGKGNFVILSGTAWTEGQTTLLSIIRRETEAKIYPELYMQDILYGMEESEYTQTILENWFSENETDVLICLSEKMTIAACSVVAESGLENEVAIVGIGDPSAFDEETAGRVRKVLLYYDMGEFGKWAADAVLALEKGTFTGAEGESVLLNGKEYTVLADTTALSDSTGTVLYMNPEMEVWEEGKSED